jgi:hypothetical protein
MALRFPILPSDGQSFCVGGVQTCAQRRHKQWGACLVCVGRTIVVRAEPHRGQGGQISASDDFFFDTDTKSTTYL